MNNTRRRIALAVAATAIAAGFTAGTAGSASANVLGVDCPVTVLLGGGKTTTTKTTTPKTTTTKTTTTKTSTPTKSSTGATASGSKAASGGAVSNT